MTLQQRVGVWHESRFPNAGPEAILAKLLEETGELARAVIGRVERRDGRGDVGDEAGQTVLVILALIARYFPEVDVMGEVELELARQSAPTLFDVSDG